MDKERAGIQSVEVGFLLLEGLTRSRGPLMLKDLAACGRHERGQGPPLSGELSAPGAGGAGRRTARYDLGPAALKLGLASLSRLDAVRLARERMPALMQTIGHTLALAVWGNRGPHHRALGGVAPGRHRQPAPGRCDATAVFGHGPLLCGPRRWLG
jgi:hypothetical protein